ncbi:glycosyltransferase [Acinetobacter kookii]
MKNILAFCFFPAFVPPSNGGQSRLFNFYKALSRWYNITLLTSTHIGGEEEVINHGLNFVERRIPKDNYFVQCYTALEQYSGGGDLSGPAIASSGSLPSLLHKAYLEEYDKADVIVHDFPFTVNYDLFIGIDNKPRIYNAHNCETILYQQLHPEKKSQFIHDIVRNSEIRMLENSDLVLYCNEDDLQEFRKVVPNAKFDGIYAPNGMMPISMQQKEILNNEREFHAVFMGSGHPPNVQAAEFIAHVLAPALPDIIFDIIGSCLPHGRYVKNVRRYGVVNDSKKADLLEKANIALNPMAAGSGSNVKVLEYFAYGLPVLSTSFGMRGIKAEAGKEYLEASLEQFIQELQQLLNKKELLENIGKVGQSLALSTYTWNAIVNPIAEQIEILVDIKAHENKKYFILALNDYDSFSGIGGGGTRTRGLYEKVQTWNPVIFVSFSDEDKIEVKQHETGIIIITVPKTQKHVLDLARVNSQFHVSATDIIASYHSTTNPWLTSIYKVLRKLARCIVVEHCYLAALPINFGDRFVYSSQNNETELKKRLLEWHPFKEELLTSVKHIEKLAVERSAATIAVSLEDAASLVKGKRTSGPVIVVRNGASIPAKGEKVEQLRQKLCNKFNNFSVVFLGSAHFPNVEAAKFIVEQLAPQCPNIQFHILGSVCSAIQKPPTNIHLWGIVDEVTKSAVMQSCTVALNPMTLGSGSNVKLADYLGNGLFVVTTEFGQRGYPLSIQEHIKVVPLDKFAKAIQQVLDEPIYHTAFMKAHRYSLFERELAMDGIAERFVEVLKNLEKPRKRVLFVTYRYAAPALGGAEANIEKFISALGNSGQFDVDVIAPEISGIHNHWRFSESYSFDSELGVPVDIPNVRFARFPVDTPRREDIDIHLHKVWLSQPNFERTLDCLLREYYERSGLTWGWGYPEGREKSISRWAFTECGIFFRQEAQIILEGYTTNEVVTTAYIDDRIIAGPWTLKGQFSLSFISEIGEVRLVTSVQQQPLDPRPLSFRVSKLLMNGELLDLSLPTLMQKYLSLLSAEQIFNLLDQSAMQSRGTYGIRLTDGRGPWSNRLESYIEDHISDYDLVITHNNVFRPAIVAIEQAKKHAVPSILIPHAHLDDDFYHFPDILECARNASITLAVPKAACNFFEAKGCNVRYMPAGCDISEQFLKEDQEAFSKIYNSNRPFILVLGRKAGAKGYQQIIDSVEHLNKQGINLCTVLIGPDDDEIPVNSPNAIYLGRQSRSVVRGALLSCMALCNMSASESFGIVLLEAWLAGKPVIVNKNCAAFHDMAIEGENAFLVEISELSKAIIQLIDNPELGQKLAKNGQNMAKSFDWKNVNANFVSICSELVMHKTNDHNPFNG